MNINPYNLTELSLSHSSLNGSYRSCERLLEFTKFLAFPRPSQEESLPAKAGIALHHAYQTWLKTSSLDAAALSLLIHYPIHLCSDTTDGRSLEACYASLIELTNHPQLYRYQVATIRNPAGQIVEAIEVPFQITITNHPFPFPVTYNGFIDAILFDTVHNSYFVGDLKTTRQSLSSYDAVYANSTQCLPYGLVLEAMHGNRISAFEIIYICLYTDILKPRVEKYEYTKTQADIQDWIMSLAWDLHTIYDRMTRGWWVKNGQSCMNWNRKCSFFDVCTSRNLGYLTSQRDLQVDSIVAQTGEYKPHQLPEPWIRTTLELPSLEMAA